MDNSETIASGSLLRRSPEIKTLAAALAKAQGDFKNPDKNKTAKVKTLSGAEYSYKYADLAPIIDMARPILAKNDLSVVQALTNNPRGVTIITLLLHSSGEFLESSFDMAIDSGAKMNEAQKLGSASTYGRRYAYCAMLGISSDEDDDGQASGNPSGSNAPKNNYSRPATTTTAQPPRAATPAPIEPPKMASKAQTDKIITLAKEKKNWTEEQTKKWACDSFKLAKFEDLTMPQGSALIGGLMKTGGTVN